MPTEPAAHRRHVAVWLDHTQARVFHVDAEGFRGSTIRNDHHHEKRHPEHLAEHAHPDDQKRYFHAIARAVEGIDEVLVVGPSTAKLHFLRYCIAHEPALVSRVVGVETVDHPTDPQVAAYARHYFDIVDQKHRAST